MEQPILVTPLEKLLIYNLSVEVYSANVEVPVLEFCNGWTVRNLGVASCTVMGDPLATGESKSIGGNRGEIFIGRIDIRFGAGVANCVVTQKFYANIPREKLATK